MMVNSWTNNQQQLAKRPGKQPPRRNEQPATATGLKKTFWNSANSTQNLQAFQQNPELRAAKRDRYNTSLKKASPGTEARHRSAPRNKQTDRRLNRFDHGYDEG